MEIYRRVAADIACSVQAAVNSNQYLKQHRAGRGPGVALMG